MYRFPSLQRTGGRKEYVGRKWNEFVGGVDKFFKEKKWDFRSFFFKKKKKKLIIYICLQNGINVLTYVLHGGDDAVK